LINPSKTKLAVLPNGTYYPDITLIISSYRFSLAPVLTSLKKQEQAPSYEVIICADGSPSSLLDEAARLNVSLDLDLRFLWQPDIGFRLSRSRNNGIRCSRGRILVFVDGDVWLPRLFLKHHFEAHSSSKRLVFGLVQKIDLPDNSISQIESLFVGRAKKSSSELTQLRWINSKWPWMACGGCNLSIRSGPDIYFDEDFEGWGGEDREFVLRQIHRNGSELFYALDASLIHIEPIDLIHTGNPFRTGHSEDLARWLKNRLLLSQKFPDDILAPCMNAVRHCHLDDNDQWILTRTTKARNSQIVIAEFSEWLLRHQI
jgi:glycosyltransferase involved in cell wall biosynthesis